MLLRATKNAMASHMWPAGSKFIYLDVIQGPEKGGAGGSMPRGDTFRLAPRGISPCRTLM